MDTKAATQTNIRIICTDANLIHDTTFDTTAAANPQKHDHGFLATCLDELGYHDTIRSLYPKHKLVTYKDKTSKFHGSYLDRILVT